MFAEGVNTSDDRSPVRDGEHEIAAGVAVDQATCSHLASSGPMLTLNTRNKGDHSGFL